VTPQSGNWVSTSLGNSGLCWTVFARNRDIAVPAVGNGDSQTLICVLVVRPRLCSTLSNPVPWQNWMAAYLGYTQRMKMLFRGWPVMVHDMHMRRRRLCYILLKCFCLHPSYHLESWVWWDWPLIWFTNHRPSVLWHCWLDDLTHKIVSEMTYNVSSLTLNPTVPYHTVAVNCIHCTNQTYFNDDHMPVIDFAIHAHAIRLKVATCWFFGPGLISAAGATVLQLQLQHTASISRGQFSDGLKTHLFRQAYLWSLRTFV